MSVKVSFQYHSSFKVEFRYVLSLAKTVLDANSHEYEYKYIYIHILYTSYAADRYAWFISVVSNFYSLFLCRWCFLQWPRVNGRWQRLKVPWVFTGLKVPEVLKMVGHVNPWKLRAGNLKIIPTWKGTSPEPNLQFWFQNVNFPRCILIWIEILPSRVSSFCGLGVDPTRNHKPKISASWKGEQLQPDPWGTY